jgi:hypothetical protein
MILLVISGALLIGSIVYYYSSCTRSKEVAIDLSSNRDEKPWANYVTFLDEHPEVKQEIQDYYDNMIKELRSYAFDYIISKNNLQMYLKRERFEWCVNDIRRSLDGLSNYEPKGLKIYHETHRSMYFALRLYLSEKTYDYLHAITLASRENDIKTLARLVVADKTMENNVDQ